MDSLLLCWQNNELMRMTYQYLVSTNFTHVPEQHLTNTLIEELSCDYAAVPTLTRNSLPSLSMTHEVFEPASWLHIVPFGLICNV